MGKEELEELKSIKKLLMCSLIRSGISSDTLGVVLGVDGSRIRQIIPVSKINKPQSQSKGKSEK